MTPFGSKTAFFEPQNIQKPKISGAREGRKWSKNDLKFVLTCYSYPKQGLFNLERVIRPPSEKMKQSIQRRYLAVKGLVIIVTPGLIRIGGNMGI